MALDWIKAQAQINRLGSALDETEELKRELAAYRRKLNQAWSADEMRYFDRTADDLTDCCGQLARDLKSLRQDIKRAMEDIQSEEAQAEAAAQAEG